MNISSQAFLQVEDGERLKQVASAERKLGLQMLAFKNNDFHYKLYQLFI